jgi:ligand-binding sensor domain-containing protein
VGSSTGLTLLRGGRFTRFTTAQGLVDDAVFRVLEDAQGYLWMSCNRGISRVSRRELEEVADGQRTTVRPLLFDRRDGMRSAECSGGMFPSGWRTRDGKLWFPTLRGLVSVDPAKMVVHRPLAQPRLEEVRVQGRPVPIAGMLMLEPGQRTWSSASPRCRWGTPRGRRCATGWWAMTRTGWTPRTGAPPRTRTCLRAATASW